MEKKYMAWAFRISLVLCFTLYKQLQWQIQRLVCKECLIKIYYEASRVKFDVWFANICKIDPIYKE